MNDLTQEILLKNISKIDTGTDTVSNPAHISEFLKNLEDLYKFLRSGINSYNIFEDEFNQISYENKDRHLIHYIFHKIEENRIDGQLKDPIFNPNAKSKLYDIEHWSPQDLTTHSNTQEDYAEYLDIYESIVENNLIHNNLSFH